MQFGGVVGAVGTIAGIGLTLDKQISALDDKVEYGLANNIPPDQVFVDHFAKASEIITTTAGSIAAEFIITAGAEAGSGLLGVARFLLTTAKVTAVSAFLTIEYKVAYEIGASIYDQDVVSQLIQSLIDSSISLFDESTDARYPEAVASITVLAKIIDQNIGVEELLNILSRSQSTFKDYAELSSLLNSINKVFDIDDTGSITNDDQLFQEVVNSIITIKEKHPNPDFIFLSVSSEDIINNLDSPTESIALAYRYALGNSNPFVVISNSINDYLYQEHNSNSELELSNFSDSYVQDKIKFFEFLDEARLNDEGNELTDSPYQDAVYEDRALDIQFTVSDGLNNGQAKRVTFGTNGDDEITNVITSTGDFLYGRGGNDTIDSYIGDDYIEGNAGNDILYGGKGEDTLHGNLGFDYLSGGDGFDKLYGGDGNDELYGFTRIIDENGNVSEQYDDGSSDYLYGGKGTDFLFGGNGIDTYHFKGGDTEFNLTDGFDRIFDLDQGNLKLSHHS